MEPQKYLLQILKPFAFEGSYTCPETGFSSVEPAKTDLFIIDVMAQMNDPLIFKDGGFYVVSPSGPLQATGIILFLTRNDF